MTAPVIVAGPNAEPRLREWTGGVGSLVLAAGARIVVGAGDGGRHWSNDFFSTVLGGLVDPGSAGLSASQRVAARLALVDSPDATGWHTSSRRSSAQVAAKIAADIGSQTGLTLSVVTAGGGVAPRAGDVVVDVSDAADGEFAVEGYELEVGDVVTIRANTTSGVFYPESTDGGGLGGVFGVWGGVGVLGVAVGGVLRRFVAPCRGGRRCGEGLGAFWGAGVEAVARGRRSWWGSAELG